jgi:hypothetical protein
LRNVEEDRGKLKKVQGFRTCLSGRQGRWRKVVKRILLIFYPRNIEEEEIGRA